MGIVSPEKGELKNHLVTDESFEVHRHQELCYAVDASMELVRGDIVCFYYFLYIFYNMFCVDDRFDHIFYNKV